MNEIQNTENGAVEVFHGVAIEKQVYMNMFSQENGTVDVVSQIREQAINLKEQIANKDVSDKKVRENLKSIAAKVAKSKVAIDDAGKSLVEDAKKKIKVVDNNRKYVRDELDALRDEIKAPAIEWEAEQERKEQEIKEIIARINSFDSQFENEEPASSQCLRARIEELQKYKEHENEQIKVAANTVMSNLLHLVDIAEKREAEQLELARLRKEQEAREQAEREARIAEEAAAKARAEIEAKVAAEKAEQERLRIEAEKRAEQAEREKQEAFEHRSKIEKEIFNQLLELGVNAEAATNIVELLVSGKFPHLQIVS